MTMKPFKELMPRQEAIDIILRETKPVTATEKIPIQESIGRVLATDIVAGFNVPPFPRASMDGYAVKAADTEKVPTKLKLIGAQHTGGIFEGTVNHGECLEIATGSPMPDGADAVVMVEYTELEGDYVVINREVTPGKNMAPAGEDMIKGTKVLESGVYITPGVLGAFAALGYTDVEVYVKPKVAIYSSGPEVAPQGTPLKPGQIYDINSYTLASVIEMNGGVPCKRGIMEDKLDSIKKSLSDASSYDLGVFSGGSSVGVKDLFGEAIEEQGEIYFHGVKTKPGKPTLFGKVDDTLVFGMPGYPTSCLNNSYVYLLPALRKMARLPPKHWVKLLVPIGEGFESKGDREQFITVEIKNGKAYRVFKQSGDITSMTHADGFIILPIGYTKLEAGDMVEVTLLHV
ncbi:MAG: molybdopterin molybdotransferase MoeA [Candidatus Bathyarchaeota archaeon]|nr:molybdopterin molybdotransferase MoeA [Candidatus Bathyarchaeota archaeon]